MPATVRPRILERHVQEGVTALLELDGWRAIRTDPVSDRARGKGFGEVGMPDYLYLRYGCEMPSIFLKLTPPSVRAKTETMWIEFKAPTKKPKPHQVDWHEAEKIRGALVRVVDNFDEFKSWYLSSGLNRRIAA
jgi:hypothetical protein